MKKFIATVLAAATLFSISVPAFATDAEEETEPVITEEEILEIIETEEVQDALEDSGIDTEEIEDAIENDEFEIIDDPKELTYGDKVQILVDDGLWIISCGIVFFLGGTIFNPLVWIFPPAGAGLLVAGVPLGIAAAIVGIGEIITAPIAAIFTDDSYFFGY